MNLYLAEDNEFIEHLSKIILDNLGNENFGVKEFINASGLNRNYLSHRIKSIKNTTVNQFITEVKLEKAREFLLEGTYTSEEVAFNVGFNSATYFNKCFRHHFGYPPGDIKKRTVNKSESNISEGEKVEILNNKTGSKNTLQSKKVKFIYAIASLFLLVTIIYIFIIPKTAVFKSKSAEKSIAVLPFKNLSINEENRYFADGVVEDILDRLAKISELRVVSRTSVEQFRESTESASEIGKKLRVNYILEGSVQRHDGKVRITIQLIDAKKDRHILSEKIDRDIEDIFDLQSDIAKLVADKLQAAISPEEKQLIEKKYTSNTQAYDYYLMGRYYWNQYYFKYLLKSMEYFEMAIKADSTFALAYAGLADINYSLASYSTIYGQTPKECYDKACKLANKALQFDKYLPEAHAVLGIVFSTGYWQWEKSRTYFEKAMAIDSNNMVTLFYYAIYLNIIGEYGTSRKYINRALEFNPYSIKFRRISSYLYYQEYKGEEALQEILLVEEILGDKFNEQTYVYWCYLDAGDTLSALQLLQEIFETNALYEEYKANANQVFPVYYSSGLTGLYRMIFKNRSDYFIDYYFASQIDSIDAAIRYLEKKYENQVPNMSYLTLSREFKKLHNDPRFLEIVYKTGLTPYFNKRYKSMEN
jgi:TolB-like protein/AraC-like DNA-binding protein